MENQLKKQEFSSILPVFTPSGIVVPDFIDKKSSGKPYILYGEDNRLPLMLYDNYLKCGYLQSIINTFSDYIIGDGIYIKDYAYLSSDGLTLEETIYKCLIDYLLIGGFTLECIRNTNKDIVRINWQNVMNVRINEDFSKAFISSDWGRWTSKDIKELPMFDGTNEQDHFIFYYRGNITRGWYPIPIYIASLKSIFTLNNIKNYNLHNIENNFSSNCIISINGSALSNKELLEIKDKITMGYTGSENAGKFILINNINTDSNIQVERLDGDKTCDLYNTVEKNAVNDVFVAFGMNPILLGKNNENIGFNKLEFSLAFALFNKTKVEPIRKEFVKNFNKLGVEIDFKGLTIDWPQE